MTRSSILRPRARVCIDLEEPHAVRRWCERLRCTRAELVEAARCVGHSVRAIKVYLRP